MSLRTRSDRWVAGGVVLSLVAICALVLPSGDGVAAPTAPPSNTVEPTISGGAEQGRTLTASRGIVERHRADLVRLPVAALWRRRRPPRRRRLHHRLGCDAPRPPARPQRRRLPDAGARHRDERRGVARRGLESDEHRRGPAREHGAAVPARIDGRRPGRHRRSRGRWTRRVADLVRVPLAALQLGRRRVRVDRRRDVAELPGQPERRRPEAPLQRDRAELARGR